MKLTTMVKDNMIKAAAYIEALGVPRIKAEHLVQAVEDGALLSISVALYDIITDWENVWSDPDMSLTDFHKLMFYVQTGELM